MASRCRYPNHRTKNVTRRNSQIKSPFALATYVGIHLLTHGTMLKEEVGLDS